MPVNQEGINKLLLLWRITARLQEKSVHYIGDSDFNFAPLQQVVYCNFMLYLTRKIGESIVINNNVEMTVVEVKGKSAKLGFEFPPEVSVLRKEIYDRIKQENEEAMRSGSADIFSDDAVFAADDTPDGQE